jgi:hypothetical protein
MSSVYISINFHVCKALFETPCILILKLTLSEAFELLASRICLLFRRPPRIVLQDKDQPLHFFFPNSPCARVSFFVSKCKLAVIYANPVKRLAIPFVQTHASGSVETLRQNKPTNSRRQSLTPGARNNVLCGLHNYQYVGKRSASAPVQTMIPAIPVGTAVQGSAVITQ